MLSPAAEAALSGLTLLDQVDSTNRYVQDLDPEQQHGWAILADRQTAGRGRRGRNWHSPAGCNIYLSLGWRFDAVADGLSGLSLAAAVAAAQAVSQSGLEQVRIKWPNDLLVDARKLGGILVEARQCGNGAILAVLGVGLNVAMPDQANATAAIGQPWTDFCSHLRSLASLLPPAAEGGFTRPLETSARPLWCRSRATASLPRASCDCVANRPWAPPALRFAHPTGVSGSPAAPRSGDSRALKDSGQRDAASPDDARLYDPGQRDAGLRDLALPYPPLPGPALPDPALCDSAAWDSALCNVGVRDQLAGRLLDHLLRSVELFQHQGFAPFRTNWHRLDALRGKSVTVSHGETLVHGRAIGIDQHGSLQVECGGTGGAPDIRTFHAGEVSVRF